jgi:4-amino-4-deoxy-L-arabinose transferase-like glycosyltransferase
MRSKHSEQLWRLLVLGVLVLALITRILALHSLSRTGYFTTLIGDELHYHRWATTLATGGNLPDSVYILSPLPAYVIALVYKIFSPDPLYIRILNIELGTAVCGLLYLIGCRLGNRSTGLGATLFGALYKPFIFYSVVPLKTTLVLFLFALSLYLFICVLNAPAYWKIALLGLVLGGLVTARENALTLIPITGGLLLLNGLHEGCGAKKVVVRFMAFLVGITIVFCPFILRNYMVTGDPTLTTHQAGFNLYLGNRLDNPHPYFRPVPFASSSPALQEIQFRIEASRRTGSMLSSKEAERFWMRQVWDLAVSHPNEFLQMQVRKIVALINQFEAGDHYDIDFMGRFAPFFSLPLLNAGILIPLGITGLILNARRSHMHLALAAIWATYALSLIPFHINGRYRLPLMMVLIPFCIIGVQQLIDWVKARQLKYVGVYVLLCCLVIGGTTWPIPAAADLSGYANVHAWMLSQKGLSDEARMYWMQSSEARGSFSDYANIALAEEAIQRKDYERALTCLDRIPDGSFAASSKYEILGDYWTSMNRVDEAVTAYDRALGINSGKISARKKLVNVLKGTNSPRTSQEQKLLQEISSYYPAISTN